VAEFTLAQILLSCKGYFRNTRDCRDASRRAAQQVFGGRGAFGETVGLIGMGMVATRLCELLRPYELRLIGHDPYLGADRAATLGVELVGLDELFRCAYVISNHLPNLPATRGRLDRRLLETMRPDATFINTGRGAQVVEADLVAVWRERPDLTALLDVTDPEPPVPGSPLYELPNVQLSSHIAGSMHDEVVRMADYAIDEFVRWERGEALRYAVTLEMLPTMA
jgi:phosphoglycerate dehydrogenase-like enzyme